MKVKEIIEILKENNVNVDAQDLLDLLDNIGYEGANIESDVDMNDVKKLSKRYKVEIKPKKVKKAPKEPAEKKEKPVAKTDKVVKETKKTEKTEKPESSSKETTKKEVKKETKPSKSESQKQPEKVAKVQTKESKQENNVKTEKPVKPEKVEQPEVAKPEKSVKPEKPAKPEKVEQPEAVNEVVNVEKPVKPEKNVELTRYYDDTYDSYAKNEKQYTRLKNVKKNKKNKEGRQSNLKQVKKETVVYYVPGMTVSAFAEALGVGLTEIVGKLMMLGYMLSASQTIDRDVAEIIADDYKLELKDKVENDITKFEEMVIDDDEESLVSRPPIVTIMGHVDHGKTTLLDTIRSSKITSGEAGGITQRIGAYQVDVKGKKITFIDTPGHAAFTEMRARGANVTDIVILVVAADDGVMPQTKEAIDHALSAKVPIIVAVNKIDKHSANPDRVKEELAALNIIPSEWGGNYEFVPVSALKGLGVDDLLETIIFVSEMENYRANPNRLGYGTVVEAQLTKGRGAVATLLVKNGTIKVGDPIVVGNVWGKIRAMSDEVSTNLKSAGPSKAVEVTGLEGVPQAGDHFMIFEDERTARLVSEERVKRMNAARNQTKTVSLASLFDNLNNTDKEINLIIKGDLQGSVEALQNSLMKLDVEGVKINIISSGVGAITDNDITLAVASKSIIIGFNVRPNSVISKNATDKGVEIRLYDVIYKLLEDIEAAMKGLLDPVFEEKVIGEVEVRKLFKVSKVGTICGSYVKDGYITRNSEVRLIRDGIVVYTGKVGTLRRGQDDVKEVRQGFECGITIQNFNDIKEGDIIEAFIMEKVEL